MKKACFIIPYFGSLPNYFQLFLNSCRTNIDYSWIVFTDDNTNFDYPENVSAIFMTFEELKKRINSKFDFKIEFTDRHKLCDFKPAYGYIFEEFLEGYQFWGHCDVDLILGDLNKYITQQMLDDYDKIFCLGHMILYKNTIANNRLFMKPMNNRFWYKESFSNNETTIFDETYGDDVNINTIFLHYGKKVFQEDFSMNCHIIPNNLIRTQYIPKEKKYYVEKYKNAIYIWKNGKVLRYYYVNGELVEEEFIYIHLQMRSMKIENVEQCDAVQILPNKFVPFEYAYIDEKNFKSIKKRVISFRFVQLQTYWMIGRIKKFFLIIQKKIK